MKENIEGSFYRDKTIKKSIQVRGNLVEELGRVGREGDIGFYELEVVNEQKYRPTKFRACIKELDSENHHYESDIDQVLKKYLSLKKIGLPVVPFLRCDRQNNFILMSDMTNNGMSEVIDKHYPRPYNFEITNIESIKKEVFEISNLAFDKNIFLYQDAYAVVVDNQTHIGKTCLIDIGRNTEFIRESYSREEANQQVEMFIDFVL
jgi:hypothetical protein